MNFKRGVLLVVFLSLIAIILFSIRYSGYVVNTISQINDRSSVNVIYTKFNGDTSSFSLMTDQTLSKINSLTLETKGVGKIVFYDDVDLFSNSIDRIIDLDKYFDISHNKISYDSEKLSSLKIPARLTFYNVGLHNPKIYRDGIICESQCNLVSYSDNTLILDISSFSQIEILETGYCGDMICNNENENCINCNNDCGFCNGNSKNLEGSKSSGDSYIEGYLSKGDTSLDSESTKNFIRGVYNIKLSEYVDFISQPYPIERNFIQLPLKQGESIEEVITLKNNFSDKRTINIFTSGLDKYLEVNNSPLIIFPGVDKNLNFKIVTDKNIIPDTYLGKLYLEMGDIGETINLMVVVKPLVEIFNIKNYVNKKEIYSGDILKGTIEIENTIQNQNLSTFLTYGILDNEGKVVSFRKESLHVKNTQSFERIIEIPENLENGDYVFFSRLNYENGSYISTDTFSIIAYEEKPMVIQERFYFGLGIFLIAFVIITVLIKLLRDKNRLNPSKIDPFRPKWLR